MAPFYNLGSGLVHKVSSLMHSHSKVSDSAFQKKSPNLEIHPLSGYSASFRNQAFTSNESSRQPVTPIPSLATRSIYNNIPNKRAGIRTSLKSDDTVFNTLFINQSTNKLPTQTNKLSPTNPFLPSDSLKDTLASSIWHDDLIQIENIKISPYSVAFAPEVQYQKNRATANSHVPALLERHRFIEQSRSLPSDHPNLHNCQRSKVKAVTSLPEEDMDGVNIDITTDNLIYTPGDFVTGTIKINSPYHVNADEITAVLNGKVNVLFQEYKNTQTYTEEKEVANVKQQIWKFVRMAELLDLPTEDDYKEAGFSAGVSSFSFRLQIPYDAPTSFYFQNCPATIRYVIRCELRLFGDLIYSREHGVAVVQPSRVPRAIANKKVHHSKIFTFSKGRSILAECSLGKGVFTPVEKVPIEIKITNRWKQSIKYVHVNVVRRVTYEGKLERHPEVTMQNSGNFDCTGVGLPSAVSKIPVGETFTFWPNINLPALTPNIEVDNIMKLDYCIKISVGRAHNFVVGEMTIPITIVTDIVDNEPEENNNEVEEEKNQTDIDVPLIDFSSSSCGDNLITTAHFVDLLA